MMMPSVLLPRSKNGESPTRKDFSRSNDLAQFPYSTWLERVSPEFRWDWKHLDYIRDALAEITCGINKRLIVNLPPQHGKSEGLTVRYPAWRLHRDPSLRIAVGAYNQTHANRFSRKSRKIVRKLIPLSADRKAANEWETPEGGSYVAVGVRAGITGLPVDLLLIDDPVKNREEADSATHQDKVWEWYMDDLMTRLSQDAPVILIMTRWNENDLTGRILGSEDGPNWKHIVLPAMAEENDPLGREIGQPLCPPLHDRKDLEEKMRVMGEGFAGLYQQQPVPRGGLFFERQWFEIVHFIPEDNDEVKNDDGTKTITTNIRRVRYWDLAATVKTTSAYSAGVLMAFVPNIGKVYIEDVVRGRWAPAERNNVIRQTAEMDMDRPGFQRTWFEEQPGGSGVETSDYLISKMMGLPVRAERVTGDKMTRAIPLADAARGNQVKILKGSWNAAFLNELASFPRGMFKDQADSASGCFTKVWKKPGTIIFG